MVEDSFQRIFKIILVLYHADTIIKEKEMEAYTLQINREHKK